VSLSDSSGASSTAYSTALPLPFSPTRGSLGREQSVYFSASALYAVVFYPILSEMSTKSSILMKIYTENSERNPHSMLAFTIR